MLRRPAPTNDTAAIIEPAARPAGPAQRGGGGAWASAIGAGIAGYGAIYFGFHDWIVHRRLPHRIVPKSDYFKRIVQAHRLHHVVESKHGSVSFGFLWAPPVEALKAELRASSRARLREPSLHQ